MFFKGEAKTAEESFKLATQIDPTLATAHFSLGELYEKQGKKDEALYALRRSLELAPLQPDAIRMQQAISGETDFWPNRSMMESMVKGEMAARAHECDHTGTANAVPYVLKALEAKGIAPEQVDYVLLTHVHLDHAGGAGQLMARFPNARLSVHPRGARHMIDEGVIDSVDVKWRARLCRGIISSSSFQVCDAVGMM